MRLQKLLSLRKLERAITFLKSFSISVLGSSLFRWIFYFPQGSQNPISLKNSKEFLQDLDKIQDQAKTPEDFLKDSSIRNSYFLAASEYFGKKKFNRDAFDQILSQVEINLKEVPLFRERIWQKRIPQNEFEIASVASVSGRVLNMNLWRLYRFQWLQRMRRVVGEDLDSENSLTITHVVFKNMRDISREIAVFKRAALASKRTGKWTSKRELLEKQGVFYKKLRSDPRTAQAAAFFILKYLKSHQMNYLLNLDNADLVLDFFRNLRQFPSKILEDIPADLAPETLLSQVKAWIPSIQDLLRDERMFKRYLEENKSYAKTSAISSKAIKFTTSRVRPFHSIWTGIPMQDCLGGATGTLDKLSPRRWAIGLVEGSLSFAFDQNGKNIGFVRIVPIQDTDGKIYGCLGLDVPTIGRSVIIETERQSRSTVPSRHSQNVFDIWFPQILSLIPKKWAGLVISDSKLCDLAQNKYVLRNSPHFIFSENLGASSQFRIEDPLASQIILSNPNPKVDEYGPGLILDSTLIDAGNIYLLREFTERKFRESHSIQNRWAANSEASERIQTYSQFSRNSSAA